MSSNPEHSKLARLARLSSQAWAAEAKGRVAEAVSLLLEMVRLDPGNRRTLHHLGDLHGRLRRPREAATWYAREARVDQDDGFLSRALALWRLVLRHDPGLLEAYERIGALYVELGLMADARLHYERSARALTDSGRAQEAAILRARLAALHESAKRPVEAELARPVPPPVPPPPDDDAADLAADQLQNGRLFHHYGLHQQARQQLELLLASLPEHLEARRILVEVCRALDDQTAASEHLRVLTYLLRRHGVDPAVPTTLQPPPDESCEEWLPVEEVPPGDVMAELLEDIREDVERVVARLVRKPGQ